MTPQLPAKIPLNFKRCQKNVLTSNHYFPSQFSLRNRLRLLEYLKPPHLSGIIKIPNRADGSEGNAFQAVPTAQYPAQHSEDT